MRGKLSKTTKLNHPLAEVFGHTTLDCSDRAKRFRKNKLCPFNNKVPNCTKTAYIRNQMLYSIEILFP
jgi:hypothetical protein